MAAFSLRKVPRRVAVPVWAIWVVLLWLGVLLVGIAVKPAGAGDASLCQFRRLTGAPCPTCGATRAVHHTLQGDVLRGSMMNPMLTLLAIGVGVWLVGRVGFGRQLSVRLSGRQRVLAWTVFGLAFVANWAYLIWRDAGPA